MNTNRRRHGTRTGERGAALVGVILLLLMMSALAAALGVSGHTETLVARNHETLAQARASAEAGLNHAVQVTIDYLRTIDPVNIPTTLNTLLVSTAALDGVTFGAATAVTGAADPDAEYEVFLMDEDDTDRGVVVTAVEGVDDENGDALTDANRTIVVRAIGRARGNTTVTLEALLAPVELGAIVVDGDLEISGSVSVQSSTSPEDADVHANGNLDIDGSASVAGDMTASGTYDGPEGGSGGQPEKPLPKIRAEDYKHHAEYVLADTGLILCNMSGGCGAVANGAMVLDCNSGNTCRTTYGWEFDGPDGWRAANNGTKFDGAFYVEGKATITANHSTWLLTVIAEGSIDLSGSPEMTSYTNELLFVTDADLDISGGVSTSISAQGQMLVHEQISLSGTVTLGGQLIVEDATSEDPLVDTNAISGNVTIDYNGTLGTNLFFVVGWREVR
jgi:hypothetical protein